MSNNSDESQSEGVDGIDVEVAAANPDGPMEGNVTVVAAHDENTVTLIHDQSDSRLGMLEMHDFTGVLTPKDQRVETNFFHNR